MILELLERGVRFACRPVLRFLDRSVSRAMGCFFACFRIRDDHRSRPRRHVLVSCRPPEAVISKNRLSSLFVLEAREESSSSNRVDDESLESPRINKELRDEATFLKACGTLPETPIEIRVATEKFKGQLPLNKDSEDLKFHSWQADLRQLSRELEKSSVSAEQSPISCISSVQASERISVSSDEGGEVAFPGTGAKINHNHTESSISFATPLTLTTKAKRKEKLVRFECHQDTSSSKGASSGNDHQNFEKLETQLDLSVSKPSPRPTPLKLSDEMQTPGTVFPVAVDVLARGKNRIRSQYVYSVANPVQDYSHWKVMKEDTANCPQESGGVTKNGEQLHNITTKSEDGVNDPSLFRVEASMSSSLRPLRSVRDYDNATDNLASKISKFDRNAADRPIIGMVAAHWHGTETSEISHKWWDGNGIPNSTTKYKEDQKVSWHATPFEERLEKALSEENVISQNKYINGRPVVFDALEESDSGLSHMQAPTHSKSVVSF